MRKKDIFRLEQEDKETLDRYLEGVEKSLRCMPTKIVIETIKRFMMMSAIPDYVKDWLENNECGYSLRVEDGGKFGQIEIKVKVEDAKNPNLDRHYYVESSLSCWSFTISGGEHSRDMRMLMDVDIDDFIREMKSLAATERQ